MPQTATADTAYLHEALHALGVDPDSILPADWHSKAKALESRIHSRAEARNRTLSVAEPVETMEQFWELVAETEAGTSERTYWDTFENGRRLQLERTLASVYGADEAILLNCGMSAISVALGACKVSGGTRLLVGRSRYFETSGLLERHLRPSGVNVREVDVLKPGAITEAIEDFQPEVVFLETVANMPSVDAIKDIRLLSGRQPSPVFIIDNSVQSVLTRWFELLGAPDQVLVLESGTKYVTNDVMCGVIYGASAPLMKAARHYARDSGQFLQARALSYLEPALLELLPLRMAVHSRNVGAFVEELAAAQLEGPTVSTLDKRADHTNQDLFRAGRGSLIYLEISGSDPAIYRQILHRWRSASLNCATAVVPDIRAGFGWLRTSSRVYESAALNRSDAPSYLRISVGLEELDAIRASALCLSDAILATQARNRELAL